MQQQDLCIGSMMKKNLNFILKGKKNIAFFRKNRSPFYSIKTGEVSGYNDVGQVMFKTLTKTTNHKESC